jgi:hypothetical protein
MANPLWLRPLSRRKLPHLLAALLATVTANKLSGCSRSDSLAAKPVAKPVATGPKPSLSLPTSIGTNLSGIAHYSTELPFIDGFKSSREWFCLWGEPGCRTKEEPQLDANGWIRKLPVVDGKPVPFATLLYREIPENFPGGKYVVLYEGEGKIEYRFGATKIAAESRPGRDVLQVNNRDANGVVVVLLETDPRRVGNYLRNIRVMQAEHEPLLKRGEIFNPLFLEKMKPFSTLRFMDWMQTNGSTQQSWANRPRPQQISYSFRGGVPVEVMVALANKLNADPWFCMPHLATDDYMRNFATYVRDNLKPNLRAYVEFSNEVWNWIFPQTVYSRDQGKKIWGVNNPMEWYGVRSAQMGQIWKQVYGKQQNRLIVVFSTQSVWQGIEINGLMPGAWIKQGNPPPHKFFDAYAIAPYFGFNVSGEQSTKFLNSLDRTNRFSGVKDPGNGATIRDIIASVRKNILYHKSIAAKYGMPLLAYEGGQHFLAVAGAENNPEMGKFWVEFNRSPEMGQLYQEYLEMWRAAGAATFVHYSSVGRASKWGSWGALEYLGQPGSVKYNQLVAFANKLRARR